MPLSLFDERVPRWGFATFDNTYTPGANFALVSGAPDTRVDRISLSNSDVAAQTISLVDLASSPPSIIGSFTIPPGTGVNGTLNAELLAGISADLAASGFTIPANTSIAVSLATAPTTGIVTALWMGGDF